MAETIYPLDDTAMTYDLTRHMYILNNDYVLNELGIDLLRDLNATKDPKRSSIAERHLKRASTLIYNFIYSFARNDAKDYIEFGCAKNPNWREPIQQALEEQVIFMRPNPDTSQTRGVNIMAGTKMALKREDAISPLAQDILQNAGILYTGYYLVPLNFDEIKRLDY